MFVRDSSAAAEPPPLSAHSPKHGEKPACWTDAKSANGTKRTFRSCSAMSAFGGKADILWTRTGVRPVAGQIEVSDWTGCAGLSKSESHGQTAFTQHRVQAAGRAGVRCRRDPLRARQAA